jgi:hypothetical protein
LKKDGNRRSEGLVFDLFKIELLELENILWV